MDPEFDAIIALYTHPSWRRSWDALEAAAWARLDGTGQVPPEVREGHPFHGLPRLRLWHDPGGVSIHPVTTFTVFELFTDTTARRPVVREALWGREPDHDRLREIVGGSREPVFLDPTVAVKFGEVDGERLTDLIRQGSAFRLPVAWLSDTESVSSGGWEWGFEFFSRDQPTASLRLTWSCEWPPDWQPVIDWFHEVWKFLRVCASKGLRG